MQPGPIAAGEASLPDPADTARPFPEHGASVLLLAQEAADEASLAGTVPAFCRGTLIQTESGDRPVEALAAGDWLVTGSGAIRPVRRVGHGVHAGRFVAGDPLVLPVRIAAGALAEGVPRRDLFVAPRQALLLGGVLIPAAALVNGSSVTQPGAVDRVEYFHVELDAHDVILAEGAATETSLPDAPGPSLPFCAPVLEDGPEVEAARQAIAVRAMPPPLAVEEHGTLQGYVDSVAPDRIWGWARDDAFPERPVRLRILAGEVVIADVLADGLRNDLVEAGVHPGRHGFDLVVPPELAFAVEDVQVRRLADGRNLPLAVPLPPGKLQGHIDRVSRTEVTGWAHDGSRPVFLLVTDNGTTIGTVLANRHRPDLEQAGVGQGRHCFGFHFPAALDPALRHRIEVRRASDGALLGGGTLEASEGLAAELRNAVAAAVAALVPGEAHAAALGFLEEQASQLRQRQADADADRAGRHAGMRARRRLGPAAPAPRLRALVLDTQLPKPNRDAGSQAILSHARALQLLGYEVAFAAAEAMEDAEGRGVLAAEGIACHGAPTYFSVEDVLRRQADCFDAVYLHRAEVAARYTGLVRRYMPGARVVYGVADLHHLRLARQAAVEDRPDLLAASHRLRLAEITAAWSADAVLTHSTAEAAILRAAVPGRPVHVVPWHVAPRPVRTPLARRHGLALVGGYGHPPNVDAALFLAEQVMPLVWSRQPGIECLLVGADAPPALHALPGPGLLLLGPVEDLHAGVFERVRLTVAPLRFGAGVKGKVLDSLAAGVPCAMTPTAAEGLALPPALQATVGANAAALAELIIRLHEDATVNAEAAAAGLAFIAEGFTASAVTEGLRAALGLNTVAGSLSPATP